MKYVLDSSVSLRWVLPENLVAEARKLRDEVRQRIHEIIAPENFIGENANALIKSERQKVIAFGDAAILFAEIMLTPRTFFNFRPFVPRALAIASQTRAGFYDCLYVALAEKEQCELVTADDRLLRNLQTQFPFIISLADLP